MSKRDAPLLALLFAAPALLAPGLAGAEDLMQVYDVAVQSDPVLRKAEQDLFATKEVQPQARALLLPNVSVKGTVDYFDQRAWGSSQIATFDRGDRFHKEGATAVVKQSVFNRANWMTLKQTDTVIAQAEAVYRNQQIDLMVRTAERYFAILQAADAVTSTEAFLRAAQRDLDQAKQRFEVGLVAITDVNESQAAYDEARANLINRQKDLDDAWDALRVIVGPLTVPLARLGEQLPLAPPEPNNIKAWADVAQRSNYSVIAAAEAVASAKTGIEIEKSGFYPQVDLQAGYDMQRSAAAFPTNSNSTFVGLTVNVPIYQGGAVMSRTRQAGYKFRAAQDQLDQTRREVNQAVEVNFRGVNSSIENIKARQAAVVSARSKVESTQAGVEVGTRTQVELVRAQRDLFSAEYEYKASRYTYILNGIRLHRATSSLTREVIAKANAYLNPADTLPPPAY